MHTRAGFGRFFIAVIAAACSVLAGCGGKGNQPTMLPAQGTGNGIAVDPRPIDPASLLADLEAIGIPEGVSPDLWRELSSEFVQAVQNRYTGAVSNHPPEGNVNRVTDLQLANDGGAMALEWSYVNYGDYDQNGEVNPADITPIALYYGATFGAADWDNAQVADGDRNGEVNLADITPIVIGYMAEVEGYSIYGGYLTYGPWELIGTVEFAMGQSNSPLAFSYYLESDNYPTYRVAPVDNLGAEGVEGLTGGETSPLDSSLNTTPGAAVIGIGSTVVFSIGLGPVVGEPIAAEVIETDGSGVVIQVLGNLVNDGDAISGDESVFDRVFSYKAQLESAVESVTYFRARITYDMGEGERTVLSNTESFLFYEELSDIRAQEILDQATAMQTDLETLAETMPLSEVAAQLLGELEADISIPFAGLTDSSEGVWWTTPEGIQCVASILGGEEGSGTSSLGTADKLSLAVAPDYSLARGERVLYNVKNYKVLVLAPYANASGAMKTVDDVAAIKQKLAASTCPQFKIDYFEGEEASIARFKEMRNYGIILISTYGTVLQSTGSYYEQIAMTGEQVTKESLKAYKSELANPESTRDGRLVIHCTGNFGITKYFVNEYFKYWGGKCIVYMCCEKSTARPDLGQAFSGGISAYLGYKKAVIPRTTQGQQYGYDVFSSLLAAQTIGEAYETTGLGKPAKYGDPYGRVFEMVGQTSLVVSESPYRIFEIPPLGPSGNYPQDPALSRANDVNSKGQVVGLSSYPAGTDTGFLWELSKDGKLTRVGGEGDKSEALAINNHGHVVGWAQNKNGHERAFLWAGGYVTDLGSHGLFSSANDINDSSFIVGQTSVEQEFVRKHPCRFTRPGIIDLGNLGSGTPSVDIPEDGEAFAVSEGGTIIGRTRDYGQPLQGAYHGFYSYGGAELLRLPYEYLNIDTVVTGYYSTMRAIDGRGGTVVGANYTEKVVPGPTGGTGLPGYGSKWNSGTLEPLFKPLNEEETEWWAPEGFDPSSGVVAYNVVGASVNDRGLIVGYVEHWTSGLETPGYRAFIIRTGKTPEWLDELLPCNSGWTLHKANAISDNGYIVGEGRLNSTTRAFFMWPVGR